MYYVIYKITNILNGKIYIGAHQTTDFEDSYMSSSKLVKSAIRKYGPNNFRKEILFIFDTPEEMFEKERELVDEEFVGRKDTYNITCGGIGSWSHWNGTAAHKESSSQGGVIGIKKLHEFLKNNPDKRFVPDWTGKKHRPESIQKIKDAIKGKHRGSNNSQYGMVWCVKISDDNYENRKKYRLDNIPEGWISIAEHKDRRKDKTNPAYGRSWYNDGKNNYYLKRTDDKIKSLVKGKIR